MDGDPNSELEWNNIWLAEGTNTWRLYPTTFRFVCNIVKSGQRVLDIGCGIGILAYHLKEAGNDVTGIDISEIAVGIMRKELGIKSYVWDMRKLPTMFDDQHFDWCIATEFLEHFTTEDADRIVAETARIGRKAVFCVPNNVLPPEECRYHHVAYTPETLKAVLERHYKYIYLGMFNDEFAIDVENPGSDKPIILPTLIAVCSQEEMQ